MNELEGETVIEKHMPNSFFNTNLHEKLQEQGVKELIVYGMMSHMCIDATVRAAVEHGYPCQVIEDACATTIKIEDKIVPAEHVHYAFKAALKGIYATVKTTEAFLK
ncbi:hypothetical protein GCM10009597_22690 [Peribacillus frigoritolerans]